VKTFSLKKLLSTNLLKEDPDVVKFLNANDTMTGVSWMDSGAEPRAFVAFDDYSFISSKKTHGAIYNFVDALKENVFDRNLTEKDFIDYVEKINGKNSADSNINNMQRYSTKILGDIKLVYEDLKSPNSVLNEYINKKDGRAKDISEVISGRYWKKYKIISFWKKQSEVVFMWDMIEKMLIDDGENPDEYKIDWLERGTDYSSKLTPVSSLKSKTKSKDDELKLSDEDYKKLMSKLHVAPPEEKKIILKQLGVGNLNKASDIANKLNMTVAQYNHIMNINETPDVVKGTNDDVIAKFNNQEARAFFIEEDYGFIGIYSGVYHSDILLYLIRFYEEFENLPDKTKSAFMELIHEHSLRDEDAVFINPEAFYNDLKNPNSNITQILKEKELPGNLRNIPGFLSGRMWERKKILSFWQDEKTVVDKWHYVENLFSELKLKLEDFDVDFMDRAFNSSLPLTPAKTVGTSKEKKTDELSAEAKQKILDILSKLHTAAPEKKKEMLNKIGANTPSKIAALADKLGFNSVAEFYHYAKLDENILKEDPDTVSYRTPDGDVIGLHYIDDDARMFAVFKGFSIIANESEMVHGTIENLIMDVQEDIDEQPRPLKIEDDTLLEINHRLEEYNLTCTNLEELAKFVTKRLEKTTRYIDLRNTADVLAGRLWSDEKVMSFWNSKNDVVKMWPHVVELFKFLNLQIQNYSIDFLERENDEDIKLEPVKNLKTPSAKVEPDKTKFDDDTQTNFIDKLFAVEPKKLKTLSPSQLKKIREKLHVMDPAEKQKFAKKVYSMKNKAAELADALGFNSVAQMNSVMKLDEQSGGKPFAAFVVAKYKSGYAATTRAADRGEVGRIGLPGGKIDINETPVEAAVREATEEGWSVDITNTNPIQIATIEGKVIYWYEGVNAKPLNDYKEKNRISPIVVSREDILNSGYRNSTLPI